MNEKGEPQLNGWNGGSDGSGTGVGDANDLGGLGGSLGVATVGPALEPSSDAELIRRIVAGQRGLFELLMRKHNRQLYRAVRGVLRNESDVEETMQQTYVEAFTHLGDFRGDAHYTTWLLRIGINQALNCARHQESFGDESAAGKDDQGLNALQSTAPTPEESVATSEWVLRALAAVDRLTPAKRAVFMLRELEDFSTADVAGILDVSEEVVKQRLHRAKEEVREALQADPALDTSEVFAFPAVRCNRIVAGVLQRLRRSASGF